MSIYINIVISGTSESLFGISDDEIYILSEFGKIGETYRRKINIGRLKQRQISRLCDSLQKREFLYIIKSKSYQNQSHKKIKTFGLTLKGFLASLAIKQSNLDNNHYFKKYLSLFPTDLQQPIKKFLGSYIAEFFLYHKSIGLKINNVKNLSQYIKDIIYDYDLISNEVDKDKLKKIHENMIVIDDIRDLITDIKTYDGNEPDEYSFSYSKLNDFEESFIEDMDEFDKTKPMKEHVKIEFLINFWPYVLDELGKGNNIESELENISDGIPPFGLSEYKEDFKEFTRKKSSIIIKQWQLRKLNFIPDSLSFSM